MPDFEHGKLNQCQVRGNFVLSSNTFKDPFTVELEDFRGLLAQLKLLGVGSWYLLSWLIFNKVDKINLRYIQIACILVTSWCC